MIPLLFIVSVVVSFYYFGFVGPPAVALFFILIAVIVTYFQNHGYFKVYKYPHEDGWVYAVQPTSREYECGKFTYNRKGFLSAKKFCKLLNSIAKQNNRLLTLDECYEVYYKFDGSKVLDA